MLEKRRAVQVGFSMVTKSPFHLHPTMVLDQQSSGSEDSSTLAMCFPGVLHFWYFQFPDSARVAHPSLQFPLGKQRGCLSSGQNSCREWNMEWHEGINLALLSMNNVCCGKTSSNSTQGTWKETRLFRPERAWRQMWTSVDQISASTESTCCCISRLRWLEVKDPDLWHCSDQTSWPDQLRQLCSHQGVP